MPHSDSSRGREEREDKSGSIRVEPQSISPTKGETVHRGHQPLHQESTGSPLLEDSEVNTGTPQESPRKAYAHQREQSVKELLISARKVLGGRLHSQGGGLTPLDYPMRKGSSRIGNSQKWNPERYEQISTSAAASAGGINEDADWGRKEEQKEQETSRTLAAAAETVTVVASAPGKVILFGEHAVVYRKPAVGAAVSDLRVVAAARGTAEASLVLELPDLDVCFRRAMDEVARYFGSALALESEAEPAPPAPALLDLISVFVGDEWVGEKRKAILPLVFLALAIVPGIFRGRSGPSARGVSIKAFSASLPVGAGLGSSAALCVATSAALTRLSSLLSSGRVGNGKAQALAGSTKALAEGDKNPTAGGGEGTGRGTRPSPSELELINSWAYAGETVLHGTPSGLDNTVSCYGGAIKFVKGVDGTGNVTEPIPGFPPLKILLTNTRVPKDTRALVAGVRRLFEAHPGPTAHTFDAIGAIATEFLERAAASAVNNGEATAIAPSEGVFEGGDGGESLTAECVGELAEMNHRLLCALGVGHPALERVCEVARAHGCKSKLTGAGGGGCALTVLYGDKRLSKDSLVKGMMSEGFDCYESSLGGDGVLWHDGEVPREWEVAEKRVEADRAVDGLVDRVKKGMARNGLRTVALATAAAAAASVAVGIASSRLRLTR